MPHQVILIMHNGILSEMQERCKSPIPPCPPLLPLRTSRRVLIFMVSSAGAAGAEAGAGVTDAVVAKADDDVDDEAGAEVDDDDAGATDTSDPLAAVAVVEVVEGLALTSDVHFGLMNRGRLSSLSRRMMYAFPSYISS
jgi:hypothetical protein